MKAFRDAMIAGMHKYFDAYGTNQLHLQILATHPDYRRQGAASSLCKWGMGIVEKKQMCISVFGSPKGKALYQHLKFMELGTLIVQVEGEEKKLTISACLYKVGKADDDWVTWVSELLKKLQLWCHGYLK